MVQQTVRVPNKLGIHARPAAMLVKEATRFESDILLTVGRDQVNAKSIMGVMTLAAGIGSEITITADGADEKEAIQSIARLIGDGFGEE